jgi:hypothetical protein
MLYANDCCLYCSQWFICGAENNCEQVNLNNFLAALEEDDSGKLISSFLQERIKTDIYKPKITNGLV